MFNHQPQSSARAVAGAALIAFMLLCLLSVPVDAAEPATESPPIYCTISKDCTNHATKVDSTPSGCNCTCTNQWTSNQCQVCPAQFSQAEDCAACNTPDYIGEYPHCYSDMCTLASCNDRAVNWTGTKSTGCICNCRNKWTENNCSKCPVGYDANADCASCSEGYTGYPNCEKKCSVEANCTNHATAVTGTAATTCTCTCRNKWNGTACQTCPEGYDESTDCGSCAKGYSGYPNCVESCDEAVACNNKAISVSGTPATGCICKCRNGWTGNQCQTCPPLYLEANDCGSCIDYYVGYPNCVRGCNTFQNCSGHATTVTGDATTGCNCSCQNAWSGDQCQTCPEGVDESASCGQCIEGYGNYPNCVPVCQESDCNNRATKITGSPGTGCICECRNQWNGSKCETCPGNLDATKDCGACKEGYGPFPQCNPPCTNAANCNGQASVVSGNVPDCTCQCRNKWSGSACNICAPPYDGEDCEQCIEGYSGFPNCALTCTMKNCTEPGTYSVSGNANTGCTCKCSSSWYGSKCDKCPWNYDPNGDPECGQCRSGLVGEYPGCYVPCTSAANCSGRAESVTGNSHIGCDCKCRNKWTGSKCTGCLSKYDRNKDCGDCAAGYQDYPSCDRTCTMVSDCSNHAANVSGSTATGCNCTCRNSWSGSSCNMCTHNRDPNQDCGACKAGYDGYPNCYRQCSVTLDCNNHADFANGTTATECTCQCRNAWYGSTCASCPTKYSRAADCGDCNTASGYGGEYPNCVPVCTNSNDCNGRASSTNGLRPNCSCECVYKWEGDDCSTCPNGYDASKNCGGCAPGYNGYPTCAPACTNADCSNHASSFSGNELIGCTCTCAHRWQGKNCSVCPEGFDSSAAGNCARCEEGYTGYPTCTRACDVDDDCSGNAASVSGTFYTGCTCSCRNKWTGPTCSTCDERFNRTNDCASCADGYEGWPVCAKKCTLASNCSAHATEVSGNELTGCICNCRNQWYDGTCSRCPQKFSAAQDCGTCSNSSLTNYPLCLEGNCTTESDCSNHSVVVHGNADSGCNCTCRNGWIGDQCETCPPQFDADADCAKCAPGYEGTYPKCFQACNIISNCSSHATSVKTLANGTCVCSCINAYSGDACEICGQGFDESTMCSSCAEGYEQYPRCYHTCTTKSNCSDHATAVSGNSNTGCSCTCSGGWSTSNCSVCPKNFNEYHNCARCNYGYDDYPTCSPVCTRENCSLHATTVSGTWASGCKCVCSDQWRGDNCSFCPKQFAVSNSTPTPAPAWQTWEVENDDPDCDRCIDGYDGYPNCVRMCTSSDDCSGHAATVSGNETSGCSCTCRNQWSWYDCSNCPKQYNKLLDCGQCADGYSGSYPNCFENCKAADDCSNHSVYVSGNTNTGCNCTCRNSWTGHSCDKCPLGIDATKDCGECLPGYEGYPNCERSCTVQNDCTNHAVNVSGTVSANSSNCACTCSFKWTGAKCTFCPAQFDPKKNCNDCNPNYEGPFPTCKRKCTVTQDCNNHATLAKGNIVDGCTCTCVNKWVGSKCDECPSLFDASKNCGDCIDGYEGYPNCVKKCTISDNCNDHAVEAKGNIRDGCTCICSHKWSGANCSVCPVGYNPYHNCSKCAEGYHSYPKCQRSCSNSRDCNNNAQSVSGNTYDGCTCKCRNAYSGDACDSCPAGTNSSTDCATCDSDYINYPSCALACTVANNCSNHASGVVGTSITGCTCSCRNNWQGANCNICPFGSDASQDCGVCASGFTGYPNCNRPCTYKDCEYHASAVSGQTISGCTCKCRNQWQSNNCSVCPFKYDSSKDCSSCAAGLNNYPTCNRPCNVFDDCNNHANSADGLTPNCECSCRNQWTGANCSVCPFPYSGIDCNSCRDGYSGYPNCSISCTNERNCSYHASIVKGNDLVGCQCTCRNQWTGPTCSVCPPQYNINLDCSGCAEGYEGTYPACYLKCTPTYNCSANAYKATGNSHTGCFCECRSAWKGPSCSLCSDIFNSSLDCSACANGYENYPTCSEVPTPAPPTPVPTNATPAPTNESTPVPEPTNVTEAPTNATTPVPEPTNATEVPATNATTFAPDTPEPTNATQAPTNASTPEPTNGTEVPSTNVTTLAPETPEPTNATEAPPVTNVTNVTEAPATNASTPEPTEIPTNATTPVPEPTNATEAPTNATTPVPEPTNATEVPATNATTFAPETPEPTNATEIPSTNETEVPATNASTPEPTEIPTTSAPETPEPTNATTDAPSPQPTNATEAPTNASTPEPSTEAPTNATTLAPPPPTNVTEIPSTNATTDTPTVAPTTELPGTPVPTMEAPTNTSAPETPEPTNATAVPPVPTNVTEAPPNSTAPEPTNTSTPVPPTRVPGAACSVETDCSNHAVAVSSLSGGSCTCDCRNQWSGSRCELCQSPRFNASADCGQCNIGYGHYPKCECVRHVSGRIDFHGLAISTEDEEYQFLKSVIADLNTHIVKSCDDLSTSDTLRGYVYQMLKATNGETAVLSVDIETLDENCTVSEIVSQCVLSAMSECFPLTETNTESSGNGHQASCKPEGIVQRTEGPCGQYGCAAAEDSLVGGLAPSDPPTPAGDDDDDSSIPFWIWIVIIGGVLMLLLLIGAGMRYRYKQNSGIFFSDPGRYTKQFEVAAEEDDIHTSVMFSEDLLAGKEEEMKTKAQAHGFADKMERKRAGSRFAKDVDGDGDGDAPPKASTHQQKSNANDVDVDDDDDDMNILDDSNQIDEPLIQVEDDDINVDVDADGEEDILADTIVVEGVDTAKGSSKVKEAKAEAMRAKKQGGGGGGGSNPTATATTTTITHLDIPGMMMQGSDAPTRSRGWSDI